MMKFYILRLERTLRKLFFASAPGGYTMYWAVMIGVILFSGYLVGGLIPVRFPELNQEQVVQLSVKKYVTALPVLQLGSMFVKATGGSVTTTTPPPVCTPTTGGGKNAYIFLLDVSGSMNGGKIQDLTQSMQKVANEFSDTDLVGISAFSSSAFEVLPVGMFKDIRPAYQAATARINASGGTSMKKGFQVVAPIIANAKAKYPEYQFNLIVISDGNPNKGQDPMTSLRSGEVPIPTQLKNAGVKIYTVGIASGGSFDRGFLGGLFGGLDGGSYDQLLKAIASEPNAPYYRLIGEDNSLLSAFADVVDEKCTPQTVTPPESPGVSQ